MPGVPAEEDVRPGELEEAERDGEQGQVVTGAEHGELELGAAPEAGGEKREVAEEEDGVRGHQLPGGQLQVLTRISLLQFISFGFS